jgi:hypothetical protein
MAGPDHHRPAARVAVPVAAGDVGQPVGDPGAGVGLPEGRAARRHPGGWAGSRSRRRRSPPAPAGQPAAHPGHGPGPGRGAGRGRGCGPCPDRAGRPPPRWCAAGCGWRGRGGRPAVSGSARAGRRRWGRASESGPVQPAWSSRRALTGSRARHQGENSRTCPHWAMLAPTWEPASRTRGSKPRSSRWAAAASLTGPAPMTTTGRWVRAVGSSIAKGWMPLVRVIGCSRARR